MASESDSLIRYVIDRMFQDILSNELKVGDILASKRQLALKYNVSRPVVDKALTHLVDRGYLRISNDGQYYIDSYDRFKDIQDLINFSKYQNQSFNEKEVKEIRELKCALDFLSIKLIKTPLSDEIYSKLNKQLNYLNLNCEKCQIKECTKCASILYNFYSILAKESNNAFLSLLYNSFKDTNIVIITNYIKKHNIAKLYNKALAILDALNNNNKEEAIKLINEELN